MIKVKTSMNTNMLIIACVLNIFTTCTRQNISPRGVSSEAVTVGDTVSVLSESIWITFQADNGDYWYGSDTDGVFLVDGEKIVQFSTKDGLSSNRVRGIQEDRLGHIYITTLAGINKFDGSAFTTLTAIESTSSTDNWRLHPDDLWFAILGENGERGPYRYDGKHLYQLRFPKHFMADEYFAQFADKPWSPYDVYFIYEDSKSHMWFGTADFGVCRYDGETFSWLYEDHLTHTPDGASFGIRSILEDADGKYWFCNTRFRYSIANSIRVDDGYTFVKYEREDGMDEIVSTDGRDYVYFMSAIKDKNGEVWLATYNQGVWRYDGEVSTHYPVMERGKNITIFSIYEDKMGQIWLGTHDSGVHRFNGEAFERFTTH